MAVITNEVFNKYKRSGEDWRSYINGNYIVNINLKNGTKERIQPDDDADFIPEFPESLDVNLTMKCRGGCAYCYQKCTPDGDEGDIIGSKFFDTLKPYTEIALQVNELDHPDLMYLLEKLKKNNVIANITVNQIHFMAKRYFIKYLVDNDYIKGLGISYINYSKEFIREVSYYPNAVLHVINGIVSKESLEPLYDKGLKVLVLGYKNLGRGVDYKDKKDDIITNNQKFLYDNLQEIISRFKVMSFDNLALEQLNVRRLLSTDDWNRFYMGDDGTFTFYIDTVTKTFGSSSLVKKEDMIPITPELDDVVKMFEVIRNRK